MKPGRFSEFITAKSTNPDFPESRLRVSGTIVGDIQLSPEGISFMITNAGTDSAGSTPGARRVYVINHSEELPLYIDNAVDPNGRLNIVVNEVTKGQRYELVITPKDVSSLTENSNGSVTISTNNPTQKTVSLRYTIYLKK